MLLSLPPSGARRAVFFFNMFAVSASIFYLLAILSAAHPAPREPPAQIVVVDHDHDTKEKTISGLADFALQKVLHEAKPIFGHYKTVQSNTSTWMEAYPDDTQLVHMNIPGTHDTATWNYSLATQEYLDHVTSLVEDTNFPPDWFRCQDKPIIDMLNDGIRAFDLRYAYDVTNSTLVFWHGMSLQSQTATVEDVLFGFYHWLDDHPSETVFLSFQHEGSSTRYASNDAGVQQLLFEALTTPAARSYIQQSNTLSTLGSARGKIVLLRRFDLDKLPSTYTAMLPGLHFSPNDWTPNGANITLTYDEISQGTAHIEDYFFPLTPRNSTAKENIAVKFGATHEMLRYAASPAHPDDLFWSFASSTNNMNTPSDTPRIQALGNGTLLTPKGGVNQQLVNVLKELKGKRLGIVMFDFYEQPGALLEEFLAVLPPPGGIEQ